jgi:hypothetical protein
VSIRETPKIQQLCLPLDIGWTWRRTAASIHGQGRRAWLGLEACGREGGCERRRATPEIQRFRLPLDIGWMRRRVTAPIHEQGRRAWRHAAKEAAHGCDRGGGERRRASHRAHFKRGATGTGEGMLVVAGRDDAGGEKRGRI